MKKQLLESINEINIVEKKKKIKTFSNSKKLKFINLILKKFKTDDDNWIKKSLEKKYLFSFFYDNQIFFKKKILDVGSGNSQYRKYLIKKNNLNIKSIDFKINFKNNKSSKKLNFKNDFFILKKKKLLDKHYDIIFANDIFPNVDNRLEEFILSAKNISPNLILTITIHPDNKFYYSRIIETSETFVYAPMNKEKIVMILKKFKKNIVNKSIFNFLEKKSKIRNRLFIVIYLNF